MGVFLRGHSQAAVDQDLPKQGLSISQFWHLSLKPLYQDPRFTNGETEAQGEKTDM